MGNNQAHYQEFVSRISNSGLSIYDPIEMGDPDLWIPAPELEWLLSDGLRGLSLEGLALRTRSKVVKESICRALGYPVPGSFNRVRPRFLGQQFDVYSQKSNNLQIWNQEISPTRRYVIIRISPDDVIERIRVVTGDILARLDRSGTLTRKYQARIDAGLEPAEMVVSEDTDNLRAILKKDGYAAGFDSSPTDDPVADTLLPIGIVFQRLEQLAGCGFIDPGPDQERNRGAELHKIVCRELGYSEYRDDGRFPDIRHQLLEIKLQTSSTIDLGLVKPDSQEPMDIPRIEGKQIRCCDARYAIFCAHTDGEHVSITHLYVTTGEAFFDRFPQFRGRVVNVKFQIPLPNDFFDR